MPPPTPIKPPKPVTTLSKNANLNRANELLEYDVYASNYFPDVAIPNPNRKGISIQESFNQTEIIPQRVELSEEDKTHRNMLAYKYKDYVHQREKLFRKRDKRLLTQEENAMLNDMIYKADKYYNLLSKFEENHVGGRKKRTKRHTKRKTKRHTKRRF